MRRVRSSSPATTLRLNHQKRVADSQTRSVHLELSENVRTHITQQLQLLQCASSKACIVLDVDDTALEMTQDHQPRALPMGMLLYQLAVELGLCIFFITARMDDDDGDNARYTLSQLHALGFETVTDLRLCPPATEVSLASIAAFKERARTEVMSAWGVDHMLVCVGDQWSDLFCLSQDQLLSMYAKFASDRYYRIVRSSTLHVKVPHREHV
jgi:hypothetical protein